MWGHITKPVTDAELEAWAEARRRGPFRFAWRFGVLRLGLPLSFPLYMLYVLWAGWLWREKLTEGIDALFVLLMMSMFPMIVVSATACGASIAVFVWMNNEYRFAMGQCERWRDFPAFRFRTNWQIFIKLVAPLAGIAAAGVTADLVFDLPPIMSRIGTLLVYVLPLILFFLYWPRMRRLFHRVRESKYQLCLSCWYDMRGNPAATDCPECGEPYGVRQARRYWRLFLNLHHSGQWRCRVASKRVPHFFEDAPAQRTE